MKQPIPFGKYFLLERINVGGMAEVFKAKATGVEGFERLVAVKRILPGIAEDEEFVTMFVDEAKIAVQLTHASIAQIFDLGRVDGSFFIALEYVQGKDLRAIFNRVRQRGEILPTPLSCFVIMKLCEGLDYAHNKHDSAGGFLNLVHRDVSPQNILVSYEGEVKIVDFGIAKAAGKVGRTQAGILKGKFGYMSPEQVQGVEIDRRSDVFGVGICLYELLTGERLFAAETDFATLEQVKSAEVLPPSTHNPRIPEELDQIVLRALARDRDARFQSAMALHDALQAFMHTSGNLYSRKDVGLYMHRLFADEIEQENARDAEYARIETTSSDEGRVGSNGVGDAPHALDRHDEEPEESAAGEEAEAHGYGADDSLSPRAPAAAEPEAEPSPAEVRRRTGTLLGVPYAAGLRAPAVPRPVPNPSSIPPLSTALSSRPPPEPSRPSLRAVAPELAHAMDWDDEELSTQIYDKPGASGDDDLDSLQASVPDSVEPGGGLLPARATEPARIYPPRLSEPHPPLARSPSPLSISPLHDQPAVSPATRGRPMLVAVISVVVIIMMIVASLVVFQPNDPGTVSLTTRPSRVDVSVDGRALGTSTSPFIIGELTADRPHEVVVSSAGHEPWSTTVTVKPGEVLTLPEVRLIPIETGFVLTTDPPSASVFVDDKRLPGHTPLRVDDIAPGEHRLRVELAGFASWESSLNATQGVVLPLPTVTLRALPPEVLAQEAESSAKRSSGRYSGSGSERGGASRASARSAAEPTDDAEPTTTKPTQTQTSTVANDEDPEPVEPSVASEPSGPTAASEPEEPEEPANDESTETADLDALSQADSSETPGSAVQGSAPETSAELGKLRVNSRPWSQVFVDGKPYGATPRLNIALSAGTHTLRLVNDEFKIEKEQEIEIVAGDTRSVVVNLMEP